ncbi:MAG: flagellar motor switch protein FliN [Candidatus Liberibacter ctenarytainae]|uniref:Flagellar motor switch protein FliN n=1 Tax=Candidatus Liberibacter ctenarytainae TaxID=2020335 RepID=A0A937ABD4_9HYPH|nr:flagellar motor switch protein FliN [Candidatus Liberibacter ctenarytainae]
MHINTPIANHHTSDDTDQIKELSKKDKDYLEKNNNILNKSYDNTGLVMNIPVNIQVILGSFCMNISNLFHLSKGDVITLDKRVGEQVDITINNQKFAKGEITIMDDDDTHFGVRIIEIINSS